MKPSAIIGTIVSVIIAVAVVSWISSSETNTHLAAQGATATKSGTVPAAAEHGNGTNAADPKDAGGESPEHPRQKALKNNPFEFSKEGPQARVEVLETKYEFGEMTLGETQSHRFTIRNVGEAPLKLAKGEATCKCTIPFVPDQEVPPGGTVDVTLEWTPKAMDWTFRQQATIWTNDPETPDIDLVVSGKVMAEGFQLPESSFNLGDVQQGETRVVTGLILARHRTDLKIESVETSSDRVTVDVSPLGAEELKTNGASMGYEFKITLAASQSVELIRESVTVHTNFNLGPVMVWQLVGRQPGPINIVGQGWYAAKQLITLGKFKARDGAQRRVSMFVTKGETPLRLEKVTGGGQIEVTLEHDPEFQNSERDRYWLTVTFPKEGIPGRQMADNPLPVELSTNDPRAPTILLNVAYEAI